MGYRKLVEQLDKEKMPKHIAIIMDGNGRWARRHNTKRINGHREGVKSVRDIVEISVEIGLEYLINELTKNNVVIRFIGSKKNLSRDYNKKVIETCKKSWNNTGLHLNVAMNYGGRQEIIDAVNEIISDMKAGKIDSSEVDEMKI